VTRPNDQRERYLEAEEIKALRVALDEKMQRKAGKGTNQTFLHLRLIVLIALTTGMRIAEIFALRWSDLLFREELIAVRGQAETWQGPVRADDAGVGSGIQTVSGRFGGRPDFPA